MRILKNGRLVQMPTKPILKKEEITTVEEVAEDNVSAEDMGEQNSPLEQYSVKELKVMLEEAGVPYPAKAKKADLIDLLETETTTEEV